MATSREALGRLASQANGKCSKGAFLTRRSADFSQE